MFSSNTFPSFTNVFPPPNSFFDHQEDDVHFNFHQRNDDPFISDEYFFHAYNTTAPPPPPVMENFTTIKHDFARQQQQLSEGSGLQYCEDHDVLLDSVISSCKKKLVASKKDGHSKIYTARGPRDRRVRLSIEIARKFFSLQDLLEFDKPSKTLDWLLTNSLAAIKELVEETNHCSSSTATNQSKVKVLETINGGSDEKNGQKKKSVLKCGDGKKKKTTPRCKAGFQANVTKEQSRVEARARARERTREKMLVKKLDDDLKTLVPGHGCDSQKVRRKPLVDLDSQKPNDQLAVIN